MKIILIIMGILYGLVGLISLIYGAVHGSIPTVVGAAVYILAAIIFFWALATIEQSQRQVRILRGKLLKMKEQKREGD